ncbi:glycosyltransferase family 1 protein [Kiritimatiellaeota bacterium B1221]|nr:glycosyltransferase family 1 protein [Kiritimatiellaeota bacterium B1221]
MKVSLQIQAAIDQRAGVGRYVHTLVPELAALRGEDKLNGFYFDFRRRGSPFSEEMLPQSPYHRLPGALIQQCWKRFGAPAYTRFAPEADVYHFPNFIIPPLPAGPKAVVNIHDCCFIKCPETMEPKNRSYLQKRLPATLRRADKILTISETMADELREAFGLPEDKVRATLLGPPPTMNDLPENQVDARVKALGVDGPFLLNVGTLEPRKNHVFLFKVFEALKYFDGKLVLCGMKGWQVEPILEAMQANGKADRILHLDYVEDDDLVALYRRAEALLFPSLYEGFGLPPVEAMRQGCPVISSDGGSLAEVVGDGGVVLPTKDPAEWAAGIEDLLSSPDRRARLINAGHKKASQFSWRKCAEETWEVYRELEN